MDKKESSKNWKRNHPNHNRKWRYGITDEQYQQLLAEQNFVCAICGKEERVEGRSLAVDHDHETNLIRGLLCNRCNRALGLFNDDPELLKKAFEYLDRCIPRKEGDDSYGKI